MSSSSLMDDAMVGTTLGGYEILDFVGRGGMGVVYKARQVSLDRIVALKVLPSHLASDEEFVLRFNKEARAAARLNHPNIIQIYDFGNIGQIYYLVMEFIDGLSVAGCIKQYGRFEEQDAINIVRQTCMALACAHQAGIIHRDIKPDNLMLTSAGEIKLGDLGLAKVTSGEEMSMTQTGAAVGTPYYISPEQIRGQKDIDARSDIYSLGASFYHMVSGQVPFDGPTGAVVMARHMTDELPDPASVVPGLSPATAAVIRRMMAKEPGQRYSSAEEVDAALGQVQAGEAPAPQPSTATAAGVSSLFVVRPEELAPQPAQTIPPPLPPSTPPPASSLPSSETSHEHRISPSTPVPGQTPPQFRFKQEGEDSSARHTSPPPSRRRKTTGPASPLPKLLVTLAVLAAVLLGAWMLRHKILGTASDLKHKAGASAPSSTRPATPSPQGTASSSTEPEPPSMIRLPPRLLFPVTIASDQPDSRTVHPEFLAVSTDRRGIVIIRPPGGEIAEKLLRLSGIEGRAARVELVCTPRLDQGDSASLVVYELKKPLISPPPVVGNAMVPPPLLPKLPSWNSVTANEPWQEPGANGPDDRSARPAYLGTISSSSSSEIRIDISEAFQALVEGRRSSLAYLFATPDPALILIPDGPSSGEERLSLVVTRPR